MSAIFTPSELLTMLKSEGVRIGVEGQLVLDGFAIPDETVHMILTDLIGLRPDGFAITSHTVGLIRETACLKYYIARIDRERRTLAEMVEELGKTHSCSAESVKYSRTLRRLCRMRLKQK